VKKLESEIATSRNRLLGEKDIARYTDILAKPLGNAEIQKNRERLKSPNLGESDKANLRDTLPENRKLVEQKLKDLQKDYPARIIKMRRSN